MRGFMILGGDGFVGLVILSSKFILSAEYKPHNYTIDDGDWPSVRTACGSSETNLLLKTCFSKTKFGGRGT